MKRPVTIIIALLWCLVATAQTNIRYVKTTDNGGAYQNDGKSWATAKNNIQDAINELHESGDGTGVVYVAAGTYTPTESTEANADGTLYTSFKIYEGISVYGGFAANEDNDNITPDDRQITGGSSTIRIGDYKTNAAYYPQRWQMANETKLSGNHDTSYGKAFLSWNSKKNNYTTSFPGNSYHVVWFATNGFTNGRANKLNKDAVVDGFTITGGYASNRITTERNHTSYGGGVYMVDGSYLSNCKITDNASMRRGGGVYLDGGGNVDACLIWKNQCAGIGVVEGYGGGICIDAKGSVRHSVIMLNSARIGGGLALCHDSKYNNSSTDIRYPMAAGCVVNNNSSTAEAGGVLLLQGGTVNHLTVVRNKCAGADVVNDGRRLGRTGGLYIDEVGQVYNTVSWGNDGLNETDASAVQYAAYTTKTSSSEKPEVFFSAFSQNEITDWSGSSRTSVYSLSNDNTGSLSILYPQFQSPTMTAGIVTLDPSTSWAPSSTTDLRGKGIKMKDYTSDATLLESGIEEDMFGKDFAPRCMIGAICPQNESYQCAIIDDVPTLFVDPSREKRGSIDAENIGSSWTHPVYMVNDALTYFRNRQNSDDGKFTIEEKQENADGTFTTVKKTYDKGQILVKQGVGTNMGNYRDQNLRSSRLEMVSNVSLYGGYPSTLTGTDVSTRNPKEYPTRITANVSADNYERNAFHVVSFMDGVHDAVLDGFQLYGGNASSTSGYTAIYKRGGGVLVEGVLVEGGTAMSGNKLKNCVIANCTADQGAAVMVEGTGAQLDMENCIIHNNEAKGGDGIITNAIIAASAGTLNLDHCTIRGNVGYPVYNAGGTVTMNNTVAHANAAESATDIASYDGNILCFRGEFASTSSNNLWDSADGNCSLGTGTLDYTYDNTSSNTHYPTFKNPTTTIGVQESLEDVTKYGGDPDFTPTNVSPLVNAASDDGMSDTDLTCNNTRNYGGAADIGALEDTDLPEYGKVIYVRDYGNTTETGGNGSSWDKAINGNSTYYTNDHSFQGYDAQLYDENIGLTGLQWAVDEAYARSIKGQTYNAMSYGGSSTVDTVYVDPTKKVQVWVAKGEYTRSEGFFMRNGVDVMGGFPPTGNPGEDERAPKTYETIIQTMTTERHKEIIDNNYSIADNRTFSYVGDSATTAKNWEAKASCYETTHTWDAGSPEYVFDGVISENTYDGITHFWHGRYINGSNTAYVYEQKSFLAINLKDDGKSSVSQIEVSGRSGSSYKAVEAVYGTNDPELWAALPAATASENPTTTWTNTQNDISSLMKGWEKITMTSQTSGDTQTLTFDSPRSYQYYFLYFSSTNNWAMVLEVNFKVKASGTDPYTLPACSTSDYDLNNYTKAYKQRRVLTQPYPYYKDGSETNNIASNPFVETTWNGFTIQNGITSMTHNRDGGAGVAIRKNGVLENCIIKNNLNYGSDNLRGGGIFCNDGTLKNCMVTDNAIECSSDPSNMGAYGGGLYMRAGTVYNTCFTGNTSYWLEGTTHTYSSKNVAGAAAFFENGMFFNNTAYNNTGYGTFTTGGYFTQGTLCIYNTIMYGNTVTKDVILHRNGENKVHSYIKNCLWEKDIHVSDGCVAVTEDCKIISDMPFVSSSDLSLLSGSAAINSATDDIKVLNSINTDTNTPVFGNAVTLPDYDANYTDRIKDCALDIGAYEYNGAGEIEPTVTETTKDDNTTKCASFYVSQNGYGDRSAKDASNSACWEKLQKVLDAAGRYKYANPTDTVKVLLAEFSQYRPRRSTVTSSETEDENPRTYSIIVPRGIIVEGGYNDKDTLEHTPFTYRNVLQQPTVLHGEYQSDGQDVNVYHTVTFTEDVFDKDGKISIADGLKDKTTDKAILDGLFITGGAAEGVESMSSSGTETDRDGGAAVVTDYAHIRNCIIYGNTAKRYGGALYLKPGALVSGCIIMKNTAEDNGGAIYVEEPATTEEEGTTTTTAADKSSIFTSTIVGNTATNGGGGVYFTSNVRINSTVLWRNTASNNDNVAGTLNPGSASASTETTEDHYPLSFCAVENLRVAGINNINVNTDDKKGTRFDEDYDATNFPESREVDISGMTDEELTNDAVTYERFFYIKQSSALARAGMEQSEWTGAYKTKYPTLEVEDLAGVSRTNTPTNTYIEIGARAYNGELIAQADDDNIMYRLFVVQTDRSSLDNSTTLQQQTESTYYQQKGSCMDNPMPHLDDALEYIRNVRKDEKIGITVKDSVFEVYLAGGTYYPYRNLSGDYTYSRAKTYAVPEGVHIYGGIDPDLHYCGRVGETDNNITKAQDGTDNKTLSGIELVYKKTETILNARKHYDHNANNIIEPWEMDEQTILSGGVVNSSDERGSYHVISCIADENVMGKLPSNQKKDENGNDVFGTGEGKDAYETGKRIVIDGVTITNGEAFEYDEATVASEYTYYKGGAICVEGNWTTGTKKSDGSIEPNFRNHSSTDHSTHPVGYRDIPLEVRYCQFTNNKAGMGGAIFTDGELTVYGCRFVLNYAEYHEAELSGGDNIPGRGGCINSASDVTVVNSLFANNETRNTVLDNGGNSNGGVFVSGEHSHVTIINCDIVRNKSAAGYPALYFYENDDSNHPYKIVNTVFWRNQASYGDSLVVNETSNKRNFLWFCAYEKNHWHDPVTTTVTDNRDFRKVPCTSLDGYIPDMFADYNSKLTTDKLSEADAIKIDNNVILSSNNDALDGPNFISPSTESGVNGYMQSTDWMMGRINNLVDNGWTYLSQTVTTTATTFDRDETTNDYIGNGIYLYTAEKMNGRTPERQRMPYGDEQYMAYADAENETSTDESLLLQRISPDPNPSHHQTYIDIGVYEYHHVKLNPAVGEQVDTLWVCEYETQGTTSSDGKTWSTATSDLQRAIETLLTSRNGHDKMVLLKTGTYQPIYTISNNLAFTVNTAFINDGATSDQNNGAGIKSLTIKAGFSDEIEDVYDIEDNPATFYSAGRNGIAESAQSHVFYIANAEQIYTNTSGAHTYKNTAIPIILDGITFVNEKATNASNGGAAIRYEDQYKSSDTSQELDAAKDDDGKEMKKLTLKNCKIEVSGGAATGDSYPSAMYVGKGGGEALIYNTLFHSNYGDPLDAYGTKVVNCTFALNGGQVKLNTDGNYASEIHNSLLWKNNQTDDNTWGAQLAIDGTAVDTYNDNDTKITNNAILGFTLASGKDEDGKGNTYLAEENDDVINGPNFIDPYEDAETDEDKQERDFGINPSKKTMHKGNIVTYYNKVHGMSEEEVTDEIRTKLKEETDLAGYERLYGAGLERGAYECIAQTRRVLYVNPNVPSNNKNGWSWENAFGYSQLQKAVDAAAVYATDDQNAYVFVKGYDGSLGESLIMRDNVKVFGNIPSSYTKQCAYTLDQSTTDENIDDDQISAYINNVNSDRPGVATPSAKQTVISGISTPSYLVNNGSMVDGFVITNATSQSSPIINVSDNDRLILRNSIVAGNTVTDNPIAYIGRGLLYNVLFRDNTVLFRDNTVDNGKPIVQLTDNSYMVNCTVGKNNGVNSGHVYNSIASTPSESSAPFAPYAKCEPLASYKNLNYQLHENAYSIDHGVDDISGVKTLFPNAIDYDTDRDLLGNPRMINAAVDNGCYETWNVAEGDTLQVCAKAHQYPHEGSVVYIHKGGKMLLDGGSFDSSNPFSPAYLLVCDGGSLYAQGNTVKLPYVAVERNISGKYALVSLPYDFNLANVTTPTYGSNYDEADKKVEETTVTNHAAYSYDGEQRASSTFSFKSSNSEMWKTIDSGSDIDACEGWLLDLNAATESESKIYRFTAYGSSATDYVYTEDENPKTVPLKQYDNCETNGATTPTYDYDFTNEYNMGWNLKGLPYLVSDYHTLGTSATDYNMSIPHIVYTLNDEENYDTKLSWDSGETLSTGDGFFTQTATMGTTETLTFKTPVYYKEETSTAAETTMSAIAISNEGGEDVVLLNPVTENASLSYTIGNDGAKLLAMNDTLPQIYVVGGNDARMSLASSAPMDEDIRLGFIAKRAGVYTIEAPSNSPRGGEPDAESLPHGGRLEGASIWLTDHLTGAVVNLSESGYTMNVEEEGEYLDRLTVRFGGTKPITPRGDTSESNGYTISVNGTSVTISGLAEGDNVRIVTAAGALFDTFTARNSEETRQLHKGYYVVNINGFAKTILCK